MATNEIFWNGKDRSLQVGVGVRSNDPVKVGAYNGVVIADDGVISKRHTGNEPGFASVRLSGEFMLEVVLAAPATPGAVVYAIASGTNKVITLTDDDDTGANLPWGVLPLGGATGTSTLPVTILPPTYEIVTAP